jgi:hypothetical protein
MFLPPSARCPVGTHDRNTVEFGIGVGEYESVVRVPKRVFQILAPDAASKPIIFTGPGSN